MGREQAALPDFAYVAEATSVAVAKLALSGSTAELSGSPEFAHI
jgi:hypothetical protein